VKFYFVLGFCILLHTLQAQTAAIDSLIKLLKTDKENADKVGHLVLLCWQCNIIGQYDMGLTYGNEGVVLAKKLNLKKQGVEGLNNIGVIYNNMGKYPEALDNYFKGYKIAEVIGDKKLQSSLLSNIGVVYDEQQNDDKAMEYYLKSKEIAQAENNKELLANNYNNMGGLFIKKDDFKTALDYFLKALKIKQELGNKRSISNSLLNIGNLYYNLGDNAKTLKFFMGALKLKEETNDKAGVVVVLNNIGTVYMEIGEYTRAEDFMKRSLSKSEEIRSLDDMSNAHFNLSDLYKVTKKFEEALLHFTTYKNLQDSISNESKSKDIGRLEAKHEFDKQQAVFDAEHKKELELGAEREKMQKYVSYSIAGGLLLVLVFAIFIYNRFQLTSKQKAIIEEQKIIVEHKQKETMDSIHYAQRIQNSILPSEKYIDRTLRKLNGDE